jgi:ubiquinone/menaquinone biosynthesis C-methylase UbiE
MPSPPPSQFYTGLVAATYRYLRSATFDPDPYERFVRRVGEPALELGCGDGDPLLDLVAAGLDVDGLDASSDMLDRCRQAAERRGLDVTLHLARMQDMDLGRRYRSIYMAGATFNLLVDDDTAGAALARIAAHLEPGGVALVPLTIPTPTPPIALGVYREHVAKNGTTMRFAVVSEERDEARRVQVAQLRYELAHDGDVVESTERSWVLHWHTQHDFHALADAAALSVLAVLDPGGAPAGPHATTFAFLLTPA